MAQSALGKSVGEGFCLVVMRIRVAGRWHPRRKWFESKAWPRRRSCPHCARSLSSRYQHRTMTHRCRDSGQALVQPASTGNVMQGSKLGCQAWAIAICLVTTNLIGRVLENFIST